MKKEMKLAAMLMIALFAIVLGSCTSDELLPQVAPVTQESEEWHSVDVNMNISRCDFDAGSTRAVSDGTGWKDGDVIYLLFIGSYNQYVVGDAKYIASEDRWSLSYYGNLPRDSKAKVQVYFFDGVSINDITATTEKVTIPATAGVYVDLSGTYIYPTGSSISIVANLKPETSRIRFKGDAGTSIKVGGINYYTTLTRGTGGMAKSFDLVSLTVHDDGYTPYIYGEFLGNPEPFIAVENSGKTYLAVCTTSMFQKGKSGWMTVPTENNHNGWSINPDASISLDKTGLVLEEKKKGTAYLTATISPSNAHKALIWSSSNEEVAIVDNTGKVTAVGLGNATITVTYALNTNKKVTCPIVVVDANDKFYVDLGLPSGTLWAYSNIGAFYVGDNYDIVHTNYYAWGETTVKDSYTSANYKCSISWDLPLSYDAAHANWGGDWKMPTKAQFEELMEKCTKTWGKYLEKYEYGMKFVGPSGESIFLPAAGYYDGSSLKEDGEYGYYLSRTYDTSANHSGYYLEILENNCWVSSLRTYDFIVGPYHYCGLCIRPVLSN